MSFTASGPKDTLTPRAYTAAEIADTVADYRHAAENARRAGFDGVEIHAQGPYLIPQFLNPRLNRRTDAYGGSGEKRARFLLDVLDAVGDVWGSDRISVKMSPSWTSGTAFTADEETLADYDRLLEKLNDGNLAYLHLRGAPGTVEERLALFSRYRAHYRGNIVANLGFTQALGNEILDRRKADVQRPSAKKLEQQIRSRMPERSLLGILARTAYWIEWWRRFGPASGNDPKLKDPFGRYVITTFVNGTNMGSYEAARHIAGVSGHELSMAANRHFSLAKLNEAITDIVNAHAKLDLSRAWGDGTTVAADGTHMDTYLNNLLAETSVRYGKPGGIAYHHIADTYIALFTHFIPCGVWEAVYIIEGLLKNASEVQPTTIHADTQGQSLPVFSLAHLLGFELMPRIRNWKDLNFYRPGKQSSYVHIDALFGEPGANVIDWDLIENHFEDLMRVAVSVREGAISSTLLLRRLRSGSKRNAHYT
ncbi:Tn3 family transposase [Streptosporangium lutulentum]|uniref:Uncharacterized protein n=1 Tax=Streptosporangium lutulentum TaxID=1461250 RepID=A0ABT9Q8T6_9ACTN|nr:Tn3 family transposase [Streptosporangium lutulentum]MDP9843161.1 hypothetical protein [Streptosporangium lutulentum]